MGRVHGESSPDLTGGNIERKSPFSLKSTPSRSQRGTPTHSERGTPTRSTCTPPRKTPNSLKEDPTTQNKADFYSIEELSPLSTPASSPPSSPRTSRSPSPVRRPESPCVSRSPISPDSPLLCPHKLSPAVTRARSFTRDLRRAASFRAARERES